MITGTTQLVGLLGYPARYSLSPQIHNAAYKAMGKDIAYAVFPVAPDDLQSALTGLGAAGVIGLSVTVPHKQTVVKVVDGADAAVKRLGAANCIVFDNGKSFAHNTDGDGFVNSLREADVHPEGLRCVVIGAGGAAAAVSEALGRAQCASLKVLARRPDAAKQVAELGGAVGAAGTLRDIESADLYVNTTPVGMSGELEGQLPLGAELIESRTTVADLVYSPLDTPLLRLARKRECRTVEGTGMLIHQAVEQIRIWTGDEPPLAAMRNALAELQAK